MAGSQVPWQAALLAAVSGALADVVRADQDLLKLNAHELALVHRFAFYLEGRLQPGLRESGLSVDLDYDRHGDSQKWLPGRPDQEGDRRFRPDLIVHRRTEDSMNLLVVEWKKHARDEALRNMQERLACLIKTGETQPRYEYGLGVLVDSSDRGIRWRVFDRDGTHTGNWRLVDPQP